LFEGNSLAHGGGCHPHDPGQRRLYRPLSHRRESRWAKIDEAQELNYPAIMSAIKATGFTGFVAQEFAPKRKPPLDSLKAAVKLCSV